MPKKILSVLVLFAFTFQCAASAASRTDWKRYLSSSGRSSYQQRESFLASVRCIQHKQQLQALIDEFENEKKRDAVPNDPLYAEQWGIQKIGLSKAVWDQYTGEGVTIGIVDTGLLYDHEDLAGNLWTNPFEIEGNGIDDDGNDVVDDLHGWDFVDGDNDALDLNGHGSHVAGVAAAVGGNSTGISGVAPKAKIMPVRVFDQFGGSTVQRVADGIRYAARSGAHIINLSIATPGLSSGALAILQEAVNFAAGLGSILVAAVGNANADVAGFAPANLEGVLAIGATAPDDTRASFSNFGSKLFMTAPGVNILSTGTPGTHLGTAFSDNYYLASGTSQAAPFVSGAIALLLDQNPNAGLEFITSQLAKTAVDLGAPGWDPLFGHGRLNVAAALGIQTVKQCVHRIKKKWDDWLCKK